MQKLEITANNKFKYVITCDFCGKSDFNYQHRTKLTFKQLGWRKSKDDRDVCPDCAVNLFSILFTAPAIIFIVFAILSVIALFEKIFKD